MRGSAVGGGQADISICLGPDAVTNLPFCPPSLKLVPIIQPKVYSSFLLAWLLPQF